jgi:hypothetical protein
MWLSYSGITSKHAIFAISYFTGDWEYVPPVIIGGAMLVPEAIQAPLFIPGSTVIGSFTVPAGGIFLDYAEWEPFFKASDTAKDYYDILDWAGMIAGQVFCRELFAYYLLPGEDPIIQPSYPYNFADPEGYTHLFPATLGTLGSSYGSWIGANERWEGMVIKLEFAGILLACTNVLSPSFYDGRTLSLNGGGFYPLIPRFCYPPNFFAGLSFFNISTLASWSGAWNDGYGNTTAERTQLTSLDSETVLGFPVTNQRGIVAGFPFYGASVLCDEYVLIDFFAYPSFSPARPRIIPSETPPAGSMVNNLLAALSLSGVFIGPRIEGGPNIMKFLKGQ